MEIILRGVILLQKVTMSEEHVRPRHLFLKNGRLRKWKKCVV